MACCEKEQLVALTGGEVLVLQKLPNGHCRIELEFGMSVP